MNRRSVQIAKVVWLFAMGSVACWTGSVTAAEPEVVPDHVVIDGVSLPFDTTIEVVGPFQSANSSRRPSRDDRDSLLALRIEGRANQQEISFQLLSQTDKGRERLESLRHQQYYKVKGRIEGARLFGPNPICIFLVEDFEAVTAAPLTVADFANRIAGFEGMAVGEGAVQLKGEKLSLAGMTGWPDGVEGKQVAVRGTVERGESGWQLTRPDWKLVELADQVDHEVSLEGALWSLNGHWWFEYRDKRLFLTDSNGRLLTFDDDHGRSATVTGTLVRQLRPSLHQISEKRDRNLVQTFVVRGAHVASRDDSTGWSDRFGPIYTTRHQVSDGVVELLAERSNRRNRLFNETDAMLYAERNAKAIRGIVRDSSATVGDVLARRVDDTQTDPILRLLYAATLAQRNDERGREFLRRSAETPGDVPAREIYFCLGIFPFLGAAGDGEPPTDCGWAEQTLISIMSTPETAEEAAHFSSIPQVLIKIQSPEARRVLLDYALRAEHDAQDSFLSNPTVTTLLCHPSAHLTGDDLLQLEAVTKDSGIRRNILGALLRLKHPAAAERFLDELGDDFVYMDFRDLSSAEVLAALRSHLHQLTGPTRTHVQMLLILGDKDPVPALVALLDDPGFTDKKLVMFELARIADPRSVAPVARLLREAPRDYFADKSKLAVTGGVESALESLARTGSRDAVRELIELLGVDLGRFGGSITRTGLQRIVAGHLIEMTGESFGVDQAGWRAWEKLQPDERFQVSHPGQNARKVFRLGPKQNIDLK